MAAVSTAGDRRSMCSAEPRHLETCAGRVRPLPGPDQQGAEADDTRRAGRDEPLGRARVSTTQRHLSSPPAVPGGVAPRSRTSDGRMRHCEQADGEKGPFNGPRTSPGSRETAPPYVPDSTLADQTVNSSERIVTPSDRRPASARSGPTGRARPVAVVAAGVAAQEFEGGVDLDAVAPGEHAPACSMTTRLCACCLPPPSTT